MESHKEMTKETHFNIGDRFDSLSLALATEGFSCQALI